MSAASNLTLKSCKIITLFAIQTEMKVKGDLFQIHKKDAELQS